MSRAQRLGVLLGSPLLMLAGGCVASAMPERAGERQRLVAGWTVEDTVDNSVRRINMRRVAGDFTLSYDLVRRNSQVTSQSVSVARGDCARQEVLDHDLVFHESAISRAFTAGLLACRASAADVRAAIAGIEPAYRLARQWSWEVAPEDAGRPCGRTPNPDVVETNATTSTGC